MDVKNSYLLDQTEVVRFFFSSFLFLFFKWKMATFLTSLMFTIHGAVSSVKTSSVKMSN